MCNHLLFVQSSDFTRINLLHKVLFSFCLNLFLCRPIQARKNPPQIVSFKRENFDVKSLPTTNCEQYENDITWRPARGSKNRSTSERKRIFFKKSQTRKDSLSLRNFFELKTSRNHESDPFVNGKNPKEVAQCLSPI